VDGRWVGGRGDLCWTPSIEQMRTSLEGLQLFARTIGRCAQPRSLGFAGFAGEKWASLGLGTARHACRRRNHIVPSLVVANLSAKMTPCRWSPERASKWAGLAWLLAASARFLHCVKAEGEGETTLTIAGSRAVQAIGTAVTGSRSRLACPNKVARA
jgi:hypothetical protein